MKRENILLEVLDTWADALVTRYGHPVWLVGSAIDIPWTEDSISDLRKVHALRDVDVVIVLPDDEFFARFGGSWEQAQAYGEPKDRYTRECGKVASWSSVTVNLNVDFKIQPEYLQKERYANKTKVRLDTIDLTKPIDKTLCFDNDEFEKLYEAIAHIQRTGGYGFQSLLTKISLLRKLYL